MSGQMRFFFTVIIAGTLPVASSASLPYVGVAAEARELAQISAPDGTVLAQQRQYITGPRGGCYYINRNGNRTYVDRSFCRR